jgi:ATP-dependent DNA helicase RecG
MARLVHEEYLKYTIPEKPTSRLQKYRLTGKGRRLLEQLDQEGDAE